MWDVCKISADAWCQDLSLSLGARKTKPLSWSFPKSILGPNVSKLPFSSNTTPPAKADRWVEMSWCNVQCWVLEHTLIRNNRLNVKWSPACSSFTCGLLIFGPSHAHSSNPFHLSPRHIALVKGLFGMKPLRPVCRAITMWSDRSNTKTNQNSLVLVSDFQRGRADTAVTFQPEKMQAESKRKSDLNKYLQLDGILENRILESSGNDKWVNQPQVIYSFLCLDRLRAALHNSLQLSPIVSGSELMWPDTDVINMLPSLRSIKDTCQSIESWVITQAQGKHSGQKEQQFRGERKDISRPILILTRA